MGILWGLIAQPARLVWPARSARSTGSPGRLSLAACSLCQLAWSDQASREDILNLPKAACTTSCRRCGRHAPASLITCRNTAQTRCLSRVKGSGASPQLRSFATSHRHHCTASQLRVAGAAGMRRRPCDPPQTLLKPRFGAGWKGGARCHKSRTAQRHVAATSPLHNFISQVWPACASLPDIEL